MKNKIMKTAKLMSLRTNKERIWVNGRRRMLLWLCACWLLSLQAVAQCPMKNTAFKSGERLTYDLYFNWQFVWVKCGKAYMNTINTLYDGQEVFKTHLITRGSKQADRFFVMRDTLVSYVTQDMVPLYFRKGAEEGSRYTVDQVKYSYPGQTTVMQHTYRNRHGEVKSKQSSSKECVYDMLSMLLRARSFDTSKFRKGQKIQFLMADGKDVEQQTIIYRRKETFKANNDVKYRCLVFSFVEYEKGKEKEIITFYITDDDNHLPVRLDLNLKFGSAKAFLTSGKGYRHPQSSIVK